MGHRGRPRSATARRRASTRSGRQAPPDYGSPQLLAHRRTLSGRTDLPADALDVLYGRGLIDEPGYRAGRSYADLARIVRRSLGLTEASVNDLWKRLVAGGGTPLTPAPAVSDGRVADRLDRARSALERRRSALQQAGSSVLFVTDSIVIDNSWPAWLKRIVRGRPGARGDFLSLNDLKHGLWTLAELGRERREARSIGLAAE